MQSVGKGKFVMRCLPWLCAAVFTQGSQAALYGVVSAEGSFGDELLIIDPADGEITDTVPFVYPAGDSADGGQELATDPSTGDMYIILDEYYDSSETDTYNRALAKVNPNTGAITLIGQMRNASNNNDPEYYNSLAFDGQGTLYAKVGQAGSNNIQLHTMNKNTGIGTYFADFAMDYPYSIQFNPNDGFLYGLGDDDFKRLNLQSKVVTEIANLTLSAGGSSISSMEFEPCSGTFLAKDYSDGDFYRVTTSGAETLLDEWDHDLIRGLAFNPLPSCAPPAPPAPVPALSAWSLTAMGAVLSLLGLLGLRRRKTA